MVISSQCKKRARTNWLLTSIIALGVQACGLDEFRRGDARLTQDAGWLGAVGDGPPHVEGGTFVEPPLCEPGVHRCDPEAGERIQVCDPLSEHGWATVETCESADACDAELGRCRVCAAGEHRCNSWRLEECNQNGTGWSLLEECPAPEYCDSRAVQCSACLPEEAYCSGSTLLSCNQNRDGYVATECESPDLCNIASMSCRDCVPGELQCNAESLVRCSDALVWELVENCANAALCALSIERQLVEPGAEVACADPVCEPGTFQCSEHDGRTLLGCPPDGDGFRTVAVCATSGACDAEAGDCTDLVCTPGTYQCSGTALEVCSGDGTRWETLDECATEGQCSTTERRCVDCEPGGLQCSADELQRCIDGAAWETVEVCASPTLCAVDSAARDQGQCLEPACADGEYRCRDEHLELCDAERDGFTVITSCSSADLCNAADGRCDVPACPSAGSHRCRGNQLERCSDDQSRWEIVDTCVDGTACDLEALGCAEGCPENRFRCNGLVPEECTTGEDGSFGWSAVAAPCATEGLCSVSDTSAGCATPVCGGTLATFRCDPAQAARIQRCNDDRTGWTTERTCGSGQTCDPGRAQQGPAQCDVCQAGSWACGNGVLSQCDADGQRLRVLETCRDASYCVASSGEGYCLRCDEGETLCSAGNLDVCAEDRRGWSDLEACEPAFGCHPTDDGTDYCNACAAPNDLRCNGDLLETCDGEQRTVVETEDCEAGCQPVMGGVDHCRECEPNTAQCSDEASGLRLVCGATGLWEERACSGGSDCFEAGDADYCGTCDPGTFTCVTSNQQQECSQDGTPGNVRTCPGDHPVCLAATGGCVECAPGTPARCTGTVGSSGREVCGNDGAFQDQNCSGNTPVCVDGACRACLPGAARCSGRNERGRQVCSASGTWQASDCSSQFVCLDGTCAECNPMAAAPRCTSSGGGGREVCVDGSWSGENCGEELVCVGGECLDCDAATQAPECLPDVAASARRICDDGQWSRSDCASPTPLCEGGSCVCDEGENRCSASGMRQRCEGGAWIDAPCTGSYCQDGECVECLDDADCSADFPICADGACQCEAGSERCTSTGAHQVCSGGMWYGASCSGDTPQCDATTGRCACIEAAERCELGVRETCQAGSFVPSAEDPECTSCSTNTDCGGLAPICDGVACVACNDDCPDDAACSSSGACVECTEEDVSACSPGTAVCGPNEVCVQCAPDADTACSGTTPICGSDHACRGCANDTECGGDLVCDVASGACVECADATDCGGNEVCNAGSCVGCVSDADCDPAAPVCDGEVCRGCEADSECELGCGPTGRCDTCAMASDCAPPTPICADGECQACEAVGCTSGACNSETGACDLCNVDDCAGICADGLCVECSGLLCPDGRLCVSGECLPCDALLDGGDGACPSGVCIAGVCVL